MFMNFSCFNPVASSYCEDDFRIDLDRFCDFIPITSTVTNLIDLFQKHAYSAVEKTGASRQNSYWSYIGNKDNLRCILLAIPFFNIPVAIYYYFFSSAIGASSKNTSEEIDLEESSKDIGWEEFSQLEEINKGRPKHCDQDVTQLNSSGGSTIRAFPQEILSLILSYTNSATFKAGFLVSKLWNKAAMDSSVVRNVINRIEIFGNKQWAQCGGHEMVMNENMEEESESLVLFIDELVKSGLSGKRLGDMLDGGIILRIPQELTLENTGTLVKLNLPESGEKGYKNFSPPEKQEHSGGSYWLWSSTTPIKDSGNKKYSVQQTMTADRGYQDSHAREVAALCFAKYSLSGTFLCEYVWARCLDTRRRGGDQIVVGFGQSGLSVDDLSYDGGFIAVLGVLRWLPAKVRS